MENTKCCKECRIWTPDVGYICGHLECSCHTQKSDTNTLREEWEKTDLYKMIDKYLRAEIFNFFDDKFNQKLEEIEREVEFKRKKGEFIKVEKELKRLKLNASEQDFNEGLDLALQIIKNKKI